MKEKNEEKEMKSIYDNEQLIEWGGWLNEFFWLCSGVNRKVVRQCPTEYAKYAGMGGTIFFTACMAALSGGYAISTVFDSNGVALIFGLFWGLLIFNLDRLIVNTMYSDGKVTISWKELGSGLPRIFMAVFLGIVISTPLELKIYEKSINTEIKTLKQEKLKELLAVDEAKLEDMYVRQEQIRNRDIVDPVVGAAGKAYTDASKELGDLQTRFNQLTSKITIISSRRNSISHIDNPAQYDKLTRDIQGLESQRNKLKPRINELAAKKAAEDETYRNAIEENRKQIATELADIKVDIEALKLKIVNAEKEYEPQLRDEFDGFQGRMMAFESLKKKKSTRRAAFFISLLFIIIECAPTFMRMMVADGSYEELLEAEKRRISALTNKINDEINSKIRISAEKNKAQVEIEVLANKELMEKLAKAQAGLLQTAINKWREEELEKINENPSAYITMTSKEEKA